MNLITPLRCNVYANVRVGTKSLKQHPSIFLTGGYWNIIRVHLIVKKMQCSIANPMRNRFIRLWLTNFWSNKSDPCFPFLVSQIARVKDFIFNLELYHHEKPNSCILPNSLWQHGAQRQLPYWESIRSPALILRSRIAPYFPPSPPLPDLWVIPIHLSPFTSPRFIQNYPC